MSEATASAVKEDVYLVKITDPFDSGYNNNYIFKDKVILDWIDSRIDAPSDELLNALQSQLQNILKKNPGYLKWLDIDELINADKDIEILRKYILSYNFTSGTYHEDKIHLVTTFCEEVPHETMKLVNHIQFHNLNIIEEIETIYY